MLNQLNRKNRGKPKRNLRENRTLQEIQYELFRRNSDFIIRPKHLKYIENNKATVATCLLYLFTENIDYIDKNPCLQKIMPKKERSALANRLDEYQQKNNSTLSTDRILQWLLYHAITKQSFFDTILPQSFNSLLEHFFKAYPLLRSKNQCISHLTRLIDKNKAPPYLSRISIEYAKNNISPMIRTLMVAVITLIYARHYYTKSHNMNPLDDTASILASHNIPGYCHFISLSVTLLIPDRMLQSHQDRTIFLKICDLHREYFQLATIIISVTLFMNQLQTLITGPNPSSGILNRILNNAAPTYLFILIFLLPQLAIIKFSKSLRGDYWSLWRKKIIFEQSLAIRRLIICYLFLTIILTDQLFNVSLADDITLNKSTFLFITVSLLLMTLVISYLKDNQSLFKLKELDSTWVKDIFNPNNFVINYNNQQLAHNNNHQPPIQSFPRPKGQELIVSKKDKIGKPQKGKKGRNDYNHLNNTMATPEPNDFPCKNVIKILRFICYDTLILIIAREKYIQQIKDPFKNITYIFWVLEKMKGYNKKNANIFKQEFGSPKGYVISLDHPKCDSRFFLCKSRHPNKALNYDCKIKPRQKHDSCIWFSKNTMNSNPLTLKDLVERHYHYDNKFFNHQRARWICQNDQQLSKLNILTPQDFRLEYDSQHVSHKNN